MAFEQLRAQIAMLMDEIAERPGDEHELQESLREKLAEMKAFGLPLPADLVALEAALEDDLEEGVPPSAAATGRGGPEEG